MTGDKGEKTRYFPALKPRPSSSEIRGQCRDALRGYLLELANRLTRPLEFEELITGIKVLAQYGGIVSADNAWNYAMQAIASQNLGPEQRRQLLELLGDAPEAVASAEPSEPPPGSNGAPG